MPQKNTIRSLKSSYKISNRRGQYAVDFLQDFDGYLNMDGYQVYESTKTKLAGCSAHARRKFIEAEKAMPKGKALKATLAISQICKLHAVQRLGSQEDTAEYVLKVRQEHAPETVVNYKVWLEKSVQQVPPTSLLGKVI
jgi:hypothetical protein